MSWNVTFAENKCSPKLAFKLKFIWIYPDKPLSLRY